MDKDEINLLIEELLRSAERWTDLSIDSLYRSADLGARNSDREFNLILALTSLCVAFLTIVLPITQNGQSLLLLISGISFLLTAIIGIIILILTISRDKRLIKSDGDWEHKTFNKYLGQTVDIRSKLFDYKKSPNDNLLAEIRSEIEKYFQEREELDTQIEQRKSVKENEISAIALKYLGLFFSIFFTLSIFVLAVWLFFGLNYS